MRRRYWLVAIPCAIVGVILVDATRGGTGGAVAALVAVSYLAVVFVVNRWLRRRSANRTES